jgi:hypothetical protein
MYGNAVDQWLASRSQLMESPEAEKVFDNTFLRRTGLSP